MEGRGGQVELSEVSQIVILIRGAGELVLA